MPHAEWETEKRLRTRPRSTDPVGTELLEWYTNLRSQNMRVSVAAAKARARVINGTPVSNKWFYRWKRQHDIVLRSVQRTTTRTIQEITALLNSFHQFLYNILLASIVSIIINLDEIPFSLSGSMNSRSTLSDRGSRNVI